MLATEKAIAMNSFVYPGKSFLLQIYIDKLAFDEKHTISMKCRMRQNFVMFFNSRKNKCGLLQNPVNVN